MGIIPILDVLVEEGVVLVLSVGLGVVVVLGVDLLAGLLGLLVG